MAALHLEDVPAFLVCSFCSGVIQDAVTLPCCLGSVCRGCAFKQVINSGNACFIDGCGAELCVPDILPDPFKRRVKKDFDRLFTEYELTIADLRSKRVDQSKLETSSFSSVDSEQDSNSGIESETILQPLNSSSGDTLGNHASNISESDEHTSDSSSNVSNSGGSDVPEPSCEMLDSCYQVEGSGGQVALDFSVKLNEPESSLKVQDQSPGLSNVSPKMPVSSSQMPGPNLKDPSPKKQGQHSKVPDTSLKVPFACSQVLDASSKGRDTNSDVSAPISFARCPEEMIESSFAELYAIPEAKIVSSRNIETGANIEGFISDEYRSDLHVQERGSYHSKSGKPFPVPTKANTDSFEPILDNVRHKEWIHVLTDIGGSAAVAATPNNHPKKKSWIPFPPVLIKSHVPLLKLDSDLLKPNSINCVANTDLKESSKKADYVNQESTFSVPNSDEDSNVPCIPRHSTQIALAANPMLVDLLDSYESKPVLGDSHDETVFVDPEASSDNAVTLRPNSFSPEIQIVPLVSDNVQVDSYPAPALAFHVPYIPTESSYSAMESNPGLLDLLDAFESNDAQYESDNLRPVPLVPNCAASPGISLQVNGDCETVSIVDPCLNDHNYIMKPRDQNCATEQLHYPSTAVTALNDHDYLARETASETTEPRKACAGDQLRSLDNTEPIDESEKGMDAEASKPLHHEQRDLEEGESHRGENLTQPTASVEDGPTLPIVNSPEFEQHKGQMKSTEKEKVVKNRTKAVAEGPSFKEALDHVRRDSGSEEGELSSEDDAADGDMNNSNAKSFKPDLQTKNQGAASMMETSEAVLWMWKEKQRQSIEGVVVTTSKYNQASKKIVYHLTGGKPVTEREDGEILSDDDELYKQTVSEIPNENVVKNVNSILNPNVTGNSNSEEVLVEQAGAYVNNFRHRQDISAWAGKSQKGINIQDKQPATKEKVRFEISPVFRNQNFPPADVTSSFQSEVRKPLVYGKQFLEITENVESSKQHGSGAVPIVASDPFFEGRVQDFLSKCRQEKSSLTTKDPDTIAKNEKASKRKSRKGNSLKSQDEIISGDNPTNKKLVKSKPKVKPCQNLLSQFDGNQKKRRATELLQESIESNPQIITLEHSDKPKRIKFALNEDNTSSNKKCLKEWQNSFQSSTDKVKNKRKLESAENEVKERKRRDEVRVVEEEFKKRRAMYAIEVETKRKLDEITASETETRRKLKITATKVASKRRRQETRTKEQQEEIRLRSVLQEIERRKIDIEKDLDLQKKERTGKLHPTPGHQVKPTSKAPTDGKMVAVRPQNNVERGWWKCLCGIKRKNPCKSCQCWPMFLAGNVELTAKEREVSATALINYPGELAEVMVYSCIHSGKKCKTIEGKHITGKMPKDSGKFANKTMVPIHLILDTKAEGVVTLQNKDIIGFCHATKRSVLPPATDRNSQGTVNTMNSKEVPVPVPVPQGLSNSHHPLLGLRPGQGQAVPQQPPINNALNDHHPSSYCLPNQGPVNTKASQTFLVFLEAEMIYDGVYRQFSQIGTVIHDGKELVEKRQYLMEVKYIDLYNQYKQSNNILETLGQGKLNMEEGRSASVHVESQALNRMLNDLLKLKRWGNVIACVSTDWILPIVCAKLECFIDLFDGVVRLQSVLEERGLVYDADSGLNARFDQVGVQTFDAVFRDLFPKKSITCDRMAEMSFVLFGHVVGGPMSMLAQSVDHLIAPTQLYLRSKPVPYWRYRLKNMTASGANISFLEVITSYSPVPTLIEFKFIETILVEDDDVHDENQAICKAHSASVCPSTSGLVSNSSKGPATIFDGAPPANHSLFGGGASQKTDMDISGISDIPEDGVPSLDPPQQQHPEEPMVSPGPVSFSSDVKFRIRPGSAR